MKRALALMAIGTVVGATAAYGQTFRIGAQGVLMTHDEVQSGKRADGAGFGGVATLRVGGLRVEGTAFRASLSPWQDTDTTDFTATQFDVRASYELANAIALEVGAGRRTISPENAAQDVGVVRVGVLSENRVARIATIWLRGAYLPVHRFSGGGEAGLSVELGFGAAVGTANGRVRARADYEFQRIDRHVFPADVEYKVPIQTQVARLGLEVGF